MFPLCILSAFVLVNFKLSTSNVAAVDLDYDDYEGSRHRSRSIEDPYDYPGRIVGGDTTDISEFPSAVQVLVRDGDMSPGFGVCAGAIIHPSWVLIAAHCIHQKEARFIKVRAGATNFDEGGAVHQVTYYKTHEDYAQTSVNIFYDIGVMKVTPDFNFGNHDIQPALLPREGDPVLKAGSIVTLIGWGRFEKYASNPDFPISEVLRKVDHLVIPMKECPTSAQNPEHAFCTVSPDDVLRSGMNGDSGSPLYFGEVLVGIHSGGSDVTSVSKEEVVNKHSNVSFFLPWIINAMQK